jgi:WhiB family transcriptional regulator, redox-sensing transcriptional regulator
MAARSTVCPRVHEPDPNEHFLKMSCKQSKKQIEVIGPMSQVRRQSAVLPRPNWGWQDAAACREEDLILFFGPDGERQPEREIRERKAKAVCADCPVRVECLNYALSRPEKYGVWGGLNEEERAAERRRRMRRANAA